MAHAIDIANDMITSQKNRNTVVVLFTDEYAEDKNQALFAAARLNNLRK